MTDPIAQINCCHWDLGRFRGVCGELERGSMRDRLLVGPHSRHLAQVQFPELESAKHPLTTIVIAL